MTLQRKMKENALQSLKNNWGRALGILLFQLGVYVFFLLLEQLLCQVLNLALPEAPAMRLDWQNGFLVDSRLAVVSATGILIEVLILTPLGMGVRRWYCDQVAGELPPILTIFSYFYSWKTLFRVVLLRIMVLLRKILWAIPFVIPCAAIFWGLRWVRVESGPAMAIYFAASALGVLVTILMGILWYFVTLRYYLTDYLFILEEGLGLHQIIRKSVAAMKGGKRQLFSLQLSMVPWGLLSLLAVPLLFVIPYYRATTAIFAKVRIEGYNRKNLTK
ncbi:MAG: DUF975 family protein [Candidatus Merdivicinus sp.]|jgi:uncharacterized membrane protein